MTDGWVQNVSTLLDEDGKFDAIVSQSSRLVPFGGGTFHGPLDSRYVDYIPSNVHHILISGLSLRL